MKTKKQVLDQHQKKISRFIKQVKNSTSYVMGEIKLEVTDNGRSANISDKVGSYRDTFHSTNLIVLAHAMGINCYLTMKDEILILHIF